MKYGQDWLDGEESAVVPAKCDRVDPSDLRMVRVYVQWRRRHDGIVPGTGGESLCGTREGGAGDLLDHLILTQEGHGQWPIIRMRPDYVVNVLHSIALDLLDRREKGEIVKLSGWGKEVCEQLAHGARKGMNLGQLGAAEQAWQEAHSGTTT